MTSKSSKPTTLQILRKANKAYSEEAEKFCRKYNEEKKINSGLRQELISLDAKLKASQMANIQSGFAMFKAFIAMEEVRDQVERMMAGAKPEGSDWVEWYHIQTGALHTLAGFVRGGKVTEAMDAIEELGIKREP